MIYVFTSIVNGWDNLRPPCIPQDDGVRFICYTNIPNLPKVTPWEYRPVYPVGEACRTARVPKILPHLMLPEDAEYSIYHDGNFQLRLEPQQIIKDLLADHDWASYEHPCRKCIYEEAAILLREKIGTTELVQAEISRYREQGFPEGLGLWANGLLVRRHTEAVEALNERWWKLYSEGCERDQLSFPVARYQLGTPTNTIRGDIWGSPYILFRWHAAWKERDGNSDYWPERSRICRRLQRLASVTANCGGIKYHEY